MHHGGVPLTAVHGLLRLITKQDSRRKDWPAVKRTRRQLQPARPDAEDCADSAISPSRVMMRRSSSAFRRSPGVTTRPLTLLEGDPPCVTRSWGLAVLLESGPRQLRNSLRRNRRGATPDDGFGQQAVDRSDVELPRAEH